MHRLFIETAALAEERPALSAEAARHLKVLRPQAGERIELFDGRGASRVYGYEAATRSLAALPEGAGIVRTAAPRPLVLFACVTKGSRWDWTIEKATELGATRIVPVISERTIVRVAADEREAKRERWRRIAIEAARQSDQRWLPEILPPVDFAAALELVCATDCYVGALVDPPAEPLVAALRRRDRASSRPPAGFVGPEGDFTPEELTALLKIATPVSFGSQVLRAETAAIFELSVMSGVLNP